MHGLSSSNEDDDEQDRRLPHMDSIITHFASFDFFPGRFALHIQFNIPLFVLSLSHVTTNTLVGSAWNGFASK